MASAGVLWDCEDPGLWAAILARHGEVLRARAGPHGPLEALDQWYREELPAAIQGRAEKHVTQPELERLLAWKLAVRGVACGAEAGPAGTGAGPVRTASFPRWAGLLPRCQALELSPVLRVTPEGPLPAAPAAAGPHQHPRARGAALCGRLSPHARRVSGSHGTVRAPGRGPRHGLWYVCRAERVPGQGPVRRRRRDRAVGQRPSLGPSLPLAVLAAGAPEVAAFMSDEAVAAVPGLPALRYTLKYYLLYLSRVRERAAALSRGSAAGCWTPQKLERALWTWTVGRKLCPDLLPDLSPCPAQGDPDGSCVAGATQ
ncbi:uncharacterized protein LOC129404428 isoform X1 [Sorex araneus]|uniref:uncharacterized protein LOC129404428 isoform X1 n=1 Tax=Sorex araneus TaxID=42254 RepID=UPI002433BE4E|nr:uncharacterized protein LOC129404428 isoform X1 [Sorex araneus]